MEAYETSDLTRLVDPAIKSLRTLLFLCLALNRVSDGKSLLLGSSCLQLSLQIPDEAVLGGAFSDRHIIPPVPLAGRTTRLEDRSLHRCSTCRSRPE